MTLIPPAPLPPACADCVTTVQPALPGAPQQQVAYKMTRAVDGKMRIDYGSTSMITDPAAGTATLLDHVKKEVRTIPIPPASAAAIPTPPQVTPPGMPAAPAPPPLPGMTVKDLGKRIVDGHEVAGTQFTLPPPPTPPAAPGMPAIPKPPLVTEVWTSTQLQVPVLTRITGPFGKQTCHCKNLAAGEPPASMFQIPAGYKKLP